MNRILTGCLWDLNGIINEISVTAIESGNQTWLARKSPKTSHGGFRSMEDFPVPPLMFCFFMKF